MSDESKRAFPKRKSYPKTIRSSKRMTPAQWAEAESLWESGQVTLADLAKKFNKAEETFSRYFKGKGLKKGAKAAEHAEKVKEKVADAIADDATVLAQRIRETKEEHYQMARAIGKLTWREVLKAQSGGSIAESTPEFKSLKEAMTVLKLVREERWAVLGLDNPDTENDANLPELVIQELTAEQIEEMQREQEADLGLQSLNIDEGSAISDDEGDDDYDDDGVVEEG